jgi:DNA-binding transcriptional regulator YiaG
LGATVKTVMNWELGHSEPALWFSPGIVRFLGYVPFDTPGDSSPLPARLRIYRRLHGLSQESLARLLAVDETTVWHWEQGKSRPNEAHQARIGALLATP